MIDLLNKILIHFNYKITRVIPRPNRYKYRKDLTKAEVSRRYKINYNRVGWSHVHYVKLNPAISRDELIRLVKEQHLKSLEESRIYRSQIKKERLTSLIIKENQSLKSTNKQEVLNG